MLGHRNKGKRVPKSQYTAKNLGASNMWAQKQGEKGAKGEGLRVERGSVGLPRALLDSLVCEVALDGCSRSCSHALSISHAC